MTAAARPEPADTPTAHAGPNVVRISALGLCPEDMRLAAARALMQPDAGWDGVHPRPLQDACDILRQLGGPADVALAVTAQPHITAYKKRFRHRVTWPDVIGLVVCILSLTVVPYLFPSSPLPACADRQVQP
jgi:hypothetical protein